VLSWNFKLKSLIKYDSLVRMMIILLSVAQIILLRGEPQDEHQHSQLRHNLLYSDRSIMYVSNALPPAIMSSLVVKVNVLMIVANVR